MLKPREADLPALFLVLVVLPLATYILLGKWNEATKKKARISILAQVAAEEACRVEVLSTSPHIPAASPPKTNCHLCARCFGPASTRCARCKSVRYCSGKCQIIHWRQGHKLECQQLVDSDFIASENHAPVAKYAYAKALPDERPLPLFFGSTMEGSMPNCIPYDISLHSPVGAADTNFMPFSSTAVPLQRSIPERIHHENWVSHKFNREIMKDEDASSHGSFEETMSGGSRNSVPIRKKVARENFIASPEEISTNQCSDGTPESFDGHLVSKSKMQPPYKSKGKNGSMFGSNNTSTISGTLYSDQNERNSSETLINASVDKEKSFKTSHGTSPAQCYTGSSKIVEAKSAGLMKWPKIPRRGGANRTSDSAKKMKILFPYEEFLKLFHCEIVGLHLRGLVNCGNSCYANAVLQCLTCTRPLIIYLLQRIHSRACRANDWCLMCELENHAYLLREGGNPLCPSRILSLLQNIGSQMGSGDQEDAHEFLRLLVASMQSKCLEGVGGEKVVDVLLQETTLIQQIFGGRLRSKVKCLRCHHESERYENIMDLTLEILGWVESLEDALTQFTAPEDLDGENMYRCERCAKYSQARKQLSIHEAPNILTIVLKRFQTGKYGKINKCITFPDMLDMIPFMTGTSDSPPLYMLYGVVVHLDTLNASFSGHYVSYVKDLQGTWFRIDDTEIEPVPLSRVMSEGAYILFYSRSHPRPPRLLTGRSASFKAPPYEKRTPSREPQSKQNDFPLGSEHVLPADIRTTVHCCMDETDIGMNDHATIHSVSSWGNFIPRSRSYTDSSSVDFSDATSSDWSLFTSSDDSSFTTESARDSFSNVDCGGPYTAEPIFSIFNPVGVPGYSNSSVSCSQSSPQPLTRFFSESSGFVVDSSW